MQQKEKETAAAPLRCRHCRKCVDTCPVKVARRGRRARRPSLSARLGTIGRSLRQRLLRTLRKSPSD